MADAIHYQNGMIHGEFMMELKKPYRLLQNGCSKSITCDEVDILAKIRTDHIMMDIRSIGTPLDPTTAPAAEYSNVEVLKKVAQKVEYTYVVGMNQTRIMVNRMSDYMDIVH